mmetsp:Transcript_23307/g.78333  ORF Transcript_23307/g.78333 Transcript_23307/m.78333 type:complete len:379 (-) Transcript_23307:279-1415(-)
MPALARVAALFATTVSVLLATEVSGTVLDTPPSGVAEPAAAPRSPEDGAFRRELQDDTQPVEAVASAPPSPPPGGIEISELDTDFTLRAAILFVSVTLILIGIAAFIGSKSDSPLARGSPLIMLNVIDFVTDCAFVGSVRNDRELFVPSLIFVVLPVLVGSIFIFYFLTRKIYREIERGESQVTEWLINNSTIAGCVCLVSLARVDILKYLPPLPDRDRARIAAAGLISVFFEDLPQVVIQGTALGKASSALQFSLAAIAFVYGILTILAGFFGRFFTACAFYVERQERIRARKETEAGANQDRPADARGKEGAAEQGSRGAGAKGKGRTLTVQVGRGGRPPAINELSPSSSAELTKAMEAEHARADGRGDGRADGRV